MVLADPPRRRRRGEPDDVLPMEELWAPEPPGRPTLGLDIFAGALGDGLDPTALDEETAEMQASLAAFSKQALQVFVPNEIRWSWPHDAITEHLQAVSDGQIKNLIINLPPRNLKSSIVSVCWNAWEWIRNPRLRYLCSSYALDLSKRDNEFTRDLIKSLWYQERWGRLFTVRRDKDAKQFFANTRGGERRATAVTAGATGHGGDRIIVDDPHDAREADSEKARTAVLEWWNGVMSSRVNQANAVKVITAQRVHHADLVGNIVDLMVNQSGERYERLIIPMEYDPKLYVQGAALPSEGAPRTVLDEELDEDLPDDEGEEDSAWYRANGWGDDDDWEDAGAAEEVPTPARQLGLFELDPADRPSALIPKVTAIGWTDPRTQLGELMVPDQWPPEWVAQQKIVQGPYRWSAQYQEAPSPAEGGRFKERYWGRYDFTAEWHRGLRPEIIVVDSAYGEDEGDPTGISVWGSLGGRLYVLYAVENREETPDLRRTLRDLNAKWKCPFLVEDKVNGKALIQDLRRGSDDGRLPSLPVIKFTPDGLDKIARAYSVVNFVAGGLVYLPEGAPWVYDWIEQHKQFPKGQHDDLVDTTAMAISWLAKRSADIRELLMQPFETPYGAGALNGAPGVNGSGGYWNR